MAFQSYDTNISTLKTATGISSNRLFAHNPTSDTETRFIDFLMDNIGGNTDPNSDNQIDGLFLIPVEVNGSTTDADGSYNTNDQYQFDNITLKPDDTLKVEVWVETTTTIGGKNVGEHVREAILNRLNANWSITTQNGLNIDTMSSYRSGTGYVTSVFECTFETYSDPARIELGFPGDVNNGMPNAGSTMVFSTDDVQKNFSISLGAAPFTNQIDLDLIIDNGVPDYDVTIERDKDSDFTDGDETTVVSTTETSEGTYTYSDGGLTSGTTYYYKATVVDESGTGDTRTATANATTL